MTIIYFNKHVEHEGWTGNINTSWKRLSHRSSTLRGHTEQKCNATLQDDGAQSGLTQKETDFHGGSLYNGDSFVSTQFITFQTKFPGSTVITVVQQNSSFLRPQTKPVYVNALCSIYFSSYG